MEGWPQRGAKGARIGRDGGERRAESGGHKSDDGRWKDLNRRKRRERRADDGGLAESGARGARIGRFNLRQTYDERRRADG